MIPTARKSRSSLFLLALVTLATCAEPTTAEAAWYRRTGGRARPYSGIVRRRNFRITRSYSPLNPVRNYGLRSSNPSAGPSNVHGSWGRGGRLLQDRSKGWSLYEGQETPEIVPVEVPVSHPYAAALKASETALRTQEYGRAKAASRKALKIATSSWGAHAEPTVEAARKLEVATRKEFLYGSSMQDDTYAGAEKEHLELMSRGVKAARRGDYREAEGLFQQAIWSAPYDRQADRAQAALRKVQKLATRAASAQVQAD